MEEEAARELGIRRARGKLSLRVADARTFVRGRQGLRSCVPGQGESV